MARRRTRARTRQRGGGSEAKTRNRSQPGAGLTASLIPRVLLGVVDGVEVVAVGALQLARDVLVSAVSGAATIGTEAVSATVSGARGVVSATSRMLGDVAETAQGTLQATISNARRGGRGMVTPRLAPSMADASGARTTSASSSRPAGARRRTRRLRLATRPARPSIAA